IFHIYTAGFGTLLAVKQRALHLVFIMAMAFIIYPASTKIKDKNKVPFYDYILGGLGIIVFGYLIVNFDANIAKGGIPTTVDLVFGSLAILLVLEVTRRSVGNALPIVAIVFLVYSTQIGPYFPGILAHRGY